jgi:hypothetical protein
LAVSVGAVVAGALAAGVLGAFTGCNTDALGDYLWRTSGGRCTLIGAANGVALGLLLARPRFGHDPTGRLARVASARRALGFGLAWLLSAIWAFVGAYIVDATGPTVAQTAFPLNRTDNEVRLVFAPNASGRTRVYLEFPSTSSGEGAKTSSALPERRLYLFWSVTSDGAGRTSPPEWRSADKNGEPIKDPGYIRVGHFEASAGQSYDIRVRLHSVSAALRDETPTLAVEGARRYRAEGYVTSMILSVAGILALAVAVPCFYIGIARSRSIGRKGPG